MSQNHTPDSVPVPIFTISDHALKVRAAMLRNDGYCPCKPQEKGNEDYKCPCLIFMTTGECCCSMFPKYRRYEQ